MPYPYGRDLTYNFYPVSDDEFEDLSSVSSPEAIYVYKVGYKPSRSEAAAGTDNGGLIETISTWSDTGDGLGKTFTITAIDDPDPTSTVNYETYWVAVNFKYDAAEQLQTVLRALPMERVWGQHKIVSTALTDLQAVFESIDDYASDAAQYAKIDLATTLLEQDLEAAGFQWAQIWRPDELNQAVAFKAVALIMFDQMRERNDAFGQRYEVYNNAYLNIIKSIQLLYDANKQGEPTSVESKGNFMRIVR